MAGQKSEERFSAVIPILNSRCSIPSSVPMPLSENITFRKIRADDLAIITEKDDETLGFLNGGSFTITIDPFDNSMEAQALNAKVTAALFTINVLGTGNPISVEKAYVIRSLRRTSLTKTHQLTGHRHSKLDPFKIDKGTDLSYASNLFPAVCTALSKHAPLRITISRYNSAIGRGSNDDKLIDLCIALESIFQSQTEISFQFALYNSILSETDIEKRVIIFSLLKKLYSERSNIVHGNKDLDDAWLAEKWSDLLRITKASILRKVDYLTDIAHASWKSHL
jgi:hypothetical protein